MGNSNITTERVKEYRRQRELARKYQDKFVIFIDILGFADFIGRSDTDPALTERIYDALTEAPFSSPIHGPPAYPKGLSYSPHTVTNFSDSLVISATRSAEGLMTVLEMGRAFACVLLQCGLLTRGGVAGGHLIHEKGLIFGPALVSAYHLESKSARFARIILDTECVKLCEAEKSCGTPTSEYFEKTVRRDNDGVYYLHVLRELEEDTLSGKIHDMQESWWAEAKKTIQIYLQNSVGKPYREKSEWFAKYYNRCIGEYDKQETLPGWRQFIDIS
ncbi:hypothetical protein F1643_03760 [Azospirillum sp. INR13]|uniref:hypothetical protein n=1 Tax=Azospirillum sp. INR13 TaxID=2596919 RepID=UPI0018927FAC|nr:hypothetical protein [Azospirillum sp. INR13]MBF5093741.1 hypothetical protein [Azospirillum sp. INR13]